MINKVIPSEHLPVTLSQLKAHLRIEYPDEDDYLTFLLQSATESVQNYIGRSLLLQTWQKVFYPNLKRTNQISLRPVLPLHLMLPFPPLLRIKTVKGKYRHSDPLDIKNYQLKHTGDQAYLEIEEPFSKIEVVYEAGYGERPADVPVDLRQGIMQLAALFYQKRQPFSLNEEPHLVSLFHPYRILRQV